MKFIDNETHEVVDLRIKTVSGNRFLVTSDSGEYICAYNSLKDLNKRFSDYEETVIEYVENEFLQLCWNFLFDTPKSFVREGRTLDLKGEKDGKEIVQKLELVDGVLDGLHEKEIYTVKSGRYRSKDEDDFE